MIDLKYLRENPEIVKQNIKNKFQDHKLPLVDEVIALDAQSRKAKQEADALRASRNVISKQIGALMGQGKKDEAMALKAQVQKDAEHLTELEAQERQLQEKVNKIMMTIPNIIDPSVPIGKDDSCNVEIEKYGEPVVPDFEIPYHTEIMEKFQGIDLDAAGKVAGNGFYYLMGDIARLHSAVISYARDFMIGRGFTYCVPPFMIRSGVVTGVMSFEEMDAEDIELIRQRDAHRLQVMEGYCKTTSCLRNYILEYFGERAGVPCDNCGNCHRDYTEVDMTTEAKWVINCIAETRGRYGQSIVVGTLLGANRARIREVGANAYRSYGALEHMKEKDLHLLIDQMQRDGYIVQTSGEYPVLQMGDITGLKREDARVMIRKFEEKEMPAASKKKARSTDSLTSAGYKLFEELRQLRLTIAKEEGMPPYIIFNDKTLIEMCVRMPENRQDMLGVSGVGENKFHKYGQRFIDAIKSFAAAHPNSATTSNVEEEGAAMYNQTGTDMYSQAGSASSKALFYIQPEDAKNFEYAEYYTISEIRDRLNAVSTAGNIKKATTTVIWDYLMTEGLMAEEEQEGIFLKSRTEQGGEQGIKAIDKVSQRGTPYQVFMYPEAVQKMIVDYFIGERGVSGDEAAALGKQANARSAWTQDEDARLVSEFKAGMKMSQIAVKHGRTNGAIRARLQKHGLV